MGNATLYWDGDQAVDLGASGVRNISPGRAFEGSRVFAGAQETTVLRLMDVVRIEKGPFSDAALYRDLVRFWGWAAQGKPFALAMDSANRFETAIEGDPAYPDKLINGGIELWTSADPPRPDLWTVTENGGTTIRRETQREHVFEGLYSLRWNTSGTDQSFARTPDSNVIAAGASCVLTFWQKSDHALGSVLYSVRNVVTGNYLQANGSWGAGEVFTSTFPIFGWTRMTRSFTNDTSSSSLRINFENNSSAGRTIWLDDVRLIVSDLTMKLRALTYITSTQQVNANDRLRLISRAGQYDELVQVASVDVGTRIVTLTARPLRVFRDRDVVRNPNWWPDLVADQSDPAIVEIPGGLYALDLKAREADPGRA